MVQKTGIDPASLAENHYSHMIRYLNPAEIGALSITSKKNYAIIFKISSEAPLIWYHKLSSPRLLTIYERSRPSSQHFSQGPNDALMLCQRRVRNIRFASEPSNERFVTILNKALENGEGLYNRKACAESSISDWEYFRNEHQTWMQEEVFAGPAGIEPDTLLSNLHSLLTKYKESPTPHALEVIERAPLIFPEDGRPSLLQGNSLNFPSFKKGVNEALHITKIAQAMQDISDTLTPSLSFGLIPSDLYLIVTSSGNFLPSLSFLRSISSEHFAAGFDFSAEESDKLKDILTQTHTYHKLVKQALTQRIYKPEEMFREVDIPSYEAELNTLPPLFQRGAKAQEHILAKRDQHARVFWRAVFLDDRETLQYIIHSHAFFYINWEGALETILDREKFSLFLYFISYPQVLDVLSSEQFGVIAVRFIYKQRNFLSTCSLSLLLPFFNYQEIVTVWKSFNHFEQLTRYFLPFVLGHHDISPTQWRHLYLLQLECYPSTKLFGMTLNALVREGRADIVTMVLRSPNLYKDIPCTSTPNPLIPFLERYPLLWDRLCSYPEESAQLLAKTIQNSGALNLFQHLGSESFAETIQLVLTHPEMVESITNLEHGDVGVVLNNFTKPYSLETLTTEGSIREALMQPVSNDPNFIEDYQPTIDSLAPILFAYDRYFLKVFIKLTQEKSDYSWELVNLFQMVKNGASLLNTLSKPPENPNLPKQTPHKTLDLLLRMGCFDWINRDALPTIGWDTIFENASTPLLEVLASCPSAAVEMPKELRQKHLPQALRAKEANFQAFGDPQQGSITTVAEHIGALLQTDACLDQRAWKVIAMKCSFFRRVALAFKLAQLLSPERFSAFYQEVPFFYHLIGIFGHFWSH